MNQSMAVAYATLGKEFLALILKVVMVRTVVTPEERKVKNQLQMKDTGPACWIAHPVRAPQSTAGKSRELCVAAVWGGR